LISSFPEILSELSKLSILDLSYNNLTSLPDSYKEDVDSTPLKKSRMFLKEFLFLAKFFLDIHLLQCEDLSLSNSNIITEYLV
jgi:Leucine-rich repeat (LRR) protein